MPFPLGPYLVVGSARQRSRPDPMQRVLVIALFLLACLGGLWLGTSWQVGVLSTNPKVDLLEPASPPQAGETVERVLVPLDSTGQAAGSDALPGPVDGASGMHLHQAPDDIQDTYSRVAEMELQNYNKQIDQYAEGDDIASYLSYLVLVREARVRMLMLEALQKRAGVLVFRELDAAGVASHIANRVSYRYFGVGTYYGSGADLLICCDADPQVDQLSQSIQESALAGLQEFVSNFNALPRDDRLKAFFKARNGGSLPGLNKDVFYLVGDRIEKHTDSALLSILP